MTFQQSFVAALEKGEATHLFAVNPEKVKKGEIALKDVPYSECASSALLSKPNSYSLQCNAAVPGTTVISLARRAG